MSGASQMSESGVNHDAISYWQIAQGTLSNLAPIMKPNAYAACSIGLRFAFVGSFFGYWRFFIGF
jgi:hypothetical protein